MNTRSATSEKQSTFEFVGRAFRYRNYRLYFGGQGISLIGTWMQQIAMSWLVYRLTNSAFYLGLIGFTGQAPMFFLTPFAGVIIDRIQRRNLVIITQTLATIQASLLAFLTLSGHIQVWHLVLLSLFLGCINAFDMPARQSFVVQMVENKQDLGNAIALNSTMFNSARLVGPSIAGILVAAIGEGLCFLVNAISFLAIIATLIAMKIPNRRIETTSASFYQGLSEGYRYVLGSPPIRYVLLFVALTSLAGMPYMVLMPVFARDILHGGPHTLGFLMGATGVGALVGSLYLASRPSALGLGRYIVIATSILGASLIAFSFSRSLPLSLSILLFTGFGVLIQMISSNTILQTIVDEDKRGRVMSFYTMAFGGITPFGSIMAGSLASKIGAPNTLIIGGIICVIGSVIFLKKLPAIQRAVRPFT